MKNRLWQHMCQYGVAILLQGSHEVNEWAAILFSGYGRGGMGAINAGRWKYSVSIFTIPYLNKYHLNLAQSFVVASQLETGHPTPTKII